MASDGRLFWMRAWWLVEELRRGSTVTARALADRFELSVPTARRAIAALRDDFHAPLVFDAAQGSWKLTDPCFDLPRLPLSAEEVAALALARSLLGQISAAAAPVLARAIEDFWSKVEAEVLARSPAGSDLGRVLSAMLPSLSQVRGETLETVLRALALRRCLRLCYRSPWSGERTERVVEPRHLLFHDGTYYLATRCRLRQGEPRNFNLAAVEGVELLAEPAPEPCHEHVERELVAGWGAFRGGKLATAAIRIEPPLSRLVATQLWHPGQQDRWEPDGEVLVRRLPVLGLPEIVRRVLSLGASATVIEPPELAKAVRAEVGRMAAKLARGAAVEVRGRPKRARSAAPEVLTRRARAGPQRGPDEASETCSPR
ncbi:MAG: WYL domain-containing transcriptional regulator [Deltaproteobacteria bacterium]|nr:WYL domain-containing transcriptional regulator [Deltaproteobacteria bacterium]